MVQPLRTNQYQKKLDPDDFRTRNPLRCALYRAKPETREYGKSENGDKLKMRWIEPVETE